jgi:hypothetical protein
MVILLSHEIFECNFLNFWARRSAVG